MYFLPPEFLQRVSNTTANIAVGVISGLGTHFAINFCKKLFSLFSFIISRCTLIQKVSKNDYIAIYADIEEYLGDVLEKYRHMMREAPVNSYLGLLFSLSKDLLGISWAIFVAAFVRFFFPDNSVSK